MTPLRRVPGGAEPTPEPFPTSTGGTTKADRVAPRVSGVAPARGAARVKVSATVKGAFSKPIRRATLTSTSVRLVRKGRSKAVPAYDAARRRFVLRPHSALGHATTYRVVISTGVRDAAGNRFDQEPKKAGLQRASWTFPVTGRQPPQCSGSEPQLLNQLAVSGQVVRVFDVHDLDGQGALEVVQ